MDNSCIQVALHDDRLEVTSPGMLYGGLTLPEAMKGRSKIRNRVVAEVFSRMELIEEWGTGIRRILKRAKEYGLPEPDFQEIGDTFRVNLYRPVNVKADRNIIIQERQQRIIEYVKQYGQISSGEARELLGLADSTTKRMLKQMVQENLLEEQGERRARIYRLR